MSKKQTSYRQAKSDATQKRRRKMYHLADDAESVFDYDLPEWLVGAD